MRNIWSKVATSMHNCNRKGTHKAKCVWQMWSSFKSLRSVAKIIQNTFKVVCIQFSQNVKMQNRHGTKLSPLKLIWISFSEQQPFVLLWATSASKIRCKVPLYVTVKGHWERSTTFAARLHCISGITSLHTIYRRIAQTDNPNTHWVYCYLMDRGVCLVFMFFFFFFTKENYNCMTAHPKPALLPRADPAWTARLETTIPRHLIVTKCTVKLSTGSACLWCTERRQQHSRSDPKHESPQPPIQRKQQASSACISKL